MPLNFPVVGAREREAVLCRVKKEGPLLAFLHERNFIHYLGYLLFTGLLAGILSGPTLGLASQSSKELDTSLQSHLLLPDNRVVVGTVVHIKSGIIQVNIGELEPLYLSVQDAAEKGITSLHIGDRFDIVLTNNDLPIDYHLVGKPGWDRVVRGALLQPLMGDYKWALIRTTQGKVEPFEISLGVRNTVMNIPVGVPAMFLINKENILIDATFGTEGALLDILTQWSKERQRLVHY